jgi:hypothetical protein
MTTPNKPEVTKPQEGANKHGGIQEHQGEKQNDGNKPGEKRPDEKKTGGAMPAPVLQKQGHRGEDGKTHTPPLKVKH